MSFSIKITNITGNIRSIDVTKTTDIYDLKKYLAALYCTNNVYIYKNTKEIVFGTIETNDIYENDILNIICQMKTGFDIMKAKEIINFYEEYIQYTKELNSVIDNDMPDKIDENHIKTFSDNCFTDNDIKKYCMDHVIDNIDNIDNVAESISSKEDISKEEIRIMFQKCRDKLEDEEKKMDQQKKEHDRTRKKLDMLKEKMAKKRHKSSNIEEKNNFCGFKKRFLLS